jgi:hypothetical protein
METAEHREPYNREVHVRIWERPEVRALRATRHEDQFRPPSLSGGCRLGKATLAGMGGKEEDAPISDLPAFRAHIR